MSSTVVGDPWSAACCGTTRYEIVKASEPEPFIVRAPPAHAPHGAHGHQVVRYVGNGGGGCCRQCQLCLCWCLSLTIGLLVILAIGLFACASQEAPSQVAPLISKYLLGDKVFNAGHMPFPQKPATLKALAKTLANVTVDRAWTWGAGDPQTIINSLYTASRVPGVFEKVPEPLRGVFWMKGNAIPEELVTIQYGRWFEDEKQYVTVWTKMGWTWTTERPDEAPAAGLLYTPEFTMRSAGVLAGVESSISWQFNNDLTYGWMQLHPSGDLSQNYQQSLLIPGLEWITADFDMTDISPPGQKPGTLWRRGIRWGVGGCKWIDFGSYQLTKIWDGNGSPVEPYYSEFIKYMGGKSMFLWMGKNGEIDFNSTTIDSSSTLVTN